MKYSPLNCSETSREICSRMLANVQFSNQHLRHLNHKFMTIRHEDMSLEPEKITTKVYDFINRTPSPTLLRWLRNSTSREPEPPPGQNKTAFDVLGRNFDTVRRSTSVVNAWRQHLSFNEMEITQTNCAQVMQLLRYKTFERNEELLDLNIPSLEWKCWLFLELMPRSL